MKNITLELSNDEREVLSSAIFQQLKYLRVKCSDEKLNLGHRDSGISYLDSEILASLIIEINLLIGIQDKIK